MKKLLTLAAVVALLYSSSSGQHFTFSGKDTENGFRVLESGKQKITVAFSIAEFDLTDLAVNREVLKKIELPGHFLPNDAGMPDLPGAGHFIAIPQGATARLRILRMQTETISGIDLAPAPRIPKTNENGPLFYAKNQAVYNTSSLYPAHPVRLSEPGRIRGTDMVMLGITPFQYNPVTKDLIVLKDIEVEVVFEGGNNIFGDDRLRSRWWDPLLADMCLNFEQAGSRQQALGSRMDLVGYEYLIICPDDPDFLAWADTIRLFRSQQGISTGIVTTAEMGGNTVSSISSYINNAYNTWDIPPSAILILGDYGTTGATVTSPIWDNYCASDNIFADVNNDDLPDIVISRIPAQHATHLETAITKFIGYETDPPTDPEYYYHPITALGWQTERWFQVCIEVVGGFFRNVLDKDPVRVNAIYDGNPAVDPWSTAPNTGTIMNYFGPNGLGYIPGTPSELGGWSGGSGTQINAAINSGSFLLLHRDHGYEQGWGEPSYSNSSLTGLDNEQLTFVYSVNCLTGKFNWGGECFAEAFYRHPKRALGIIAASEVSYSFVNDTYVWGAFDNMWPEFMPGYGSNPSSGGHLTAFSNAAGKFFLQQSGWPYNSDNKEVTYHLFHHFGDAFSTIYSEVPEELLVVHNDVIMGGSPTFTIEADSGALVCLSVNGEIIGVATATGVPEEVAIIPQLPGTVVDVVITLCNHFRYETQLQVISPNSPYVIYQGHLIRDESGNNNGEADYGEALGLDITLFNIGNIDASNVLVTLTSEDPNVLITDGTENAAFIPGNQTISLPQAFSVVIADSIADGHLVFFNLVTTDGDSTWYSEFYLTGRAPVLEFTGYTINDEQGNNNGRIDPGEMAFVNIHIRNSGNSTASEVTTGLGTSESMITVLSDSQESGLLGPGLSSMLSFLVAADAATPGGTTAPFEVSVSAALNRQGEGLFDLVIGQYAALILDLDPNHHSAPAILESFTDLDLIADYRTDWPADLKEYKSVFLSLGIYYSSHELTSAESEILSAYLEDGGRLYMEGRLTWHVDEQTPLHAMFNVATLPANWYEYETLHGFSGDFAEGMQFGYDMTQPFNNHYLLSVSPAREIMGSEPDSRAVMVAYDAGDYKTIGSSFEFGGLVGGAPPSTRQQLLSEILGFFGDILTETDENPLTTTGIKVSSWPVPASEKVNLGFYLGSEQQVQLEIFDLTGRKITTLHQGILPKGDHVFTWQRPIYGFAPGHSMYFFKFSAGRENTGGKLIFK